MGSNLNFQVLFFVACVFLEQSIAISGLRCSTSVDLAILVDSSNSVGDGNFELVRQFIVNIVEEFDVSSDKTRVSLARYSSWVDSIFHFNTYTKKSDVIQAIRDVPYDGRDINTALGLTILNEIHISELNGWRNMQVPTVVIVIIGSKAKNAKDISAIASTLRSKVTKVIAVGIGNVDETKLIKIASNPASDNVIITVDFSHLANVVPGLVDLACNA